MDNLPSDFSTMNTGVNDRHLPECENQEIGMMCICDEILEKQEAVIEYNQEVNGVILEGVKI